MGFDPSFPVGDKVVVDALNIARGDGRIIRLEGFDSQEEALAAIGAD